MNYTENSSLLICVDIIYTNQERTVLGIIFMVKIKTPQEIKIMKQGGRILATVMRELQKMAVPGITTNDLDRAAEALVLKLGGQCSFKGYRSEGKGNPYPACICVSVNDEVVHMPPSDRVLKQGDVLAIDMGVLYQGFHTDMAITAPVGKVSPEASRLIRATKKALKRGIKKVRPGNTLGDIGNTIQRYVESQGFGVVRDLCGHGIGRDIHEDPKIVNYGKRGEGLALAEGMVICLEPMVAAGDFKLKKSADGFGYLTADGSLSAHFEATVAITKRGAEVLTK